MSGAAICTLICSGMPEVVDSQLPTALPSSQKQNAPSPPSPAGSRPPWCRPGALPSCAHRLAAPLMGAPACQYESMVLLSELHGTQGLLAQAPPGTLCGASLQLAARAQVSQVCWAAGGCGTRVGLHIVHEREGGDEHGKQHDPGT